MKCFAGKIAYSNYLNPKINIRFSPILKFFACEGHIQECSQPSGPKQADLRIQMVRLNSNFIN